MPRLIVFGDMPVARATALIPPRPDAKASQPAHRRFSRSFIRCDSVAYLPCTVAIIRVRPCTNERRQKLLSQRPPIRQVVLLRRLRARKSASVRHRIRRPGGGPYPALEAPDCPSVTPRGARRPL